MIAPIIEELSNDYEGQAKFVKVNVDHNPETSMKYGIRSIPTLLFFKDGEKVHQEIGAVPKARLEEALGKLV